MQTIDFTRRLPVKKEYDVIVAGGGVAGVAAAVSVAKRGRSVLLLEKSNILGGLGTLGLINLFVPMCNGRGKQIIKGLADKWLWMSTEIGFSTVPKDWQNGEPKEPTKQRLCQQYSPYIFALQLLDETLKAGVELLYDCIATQPVMEGGHCIGVVTDSKSGLEYYACKQLIDTTGDADLLRRAGVPTVSGQNYFTYVGTAITVAGCKRVAETGNIRLAYSGLNGGYINLYGDDQPADKPLWHGLTAEDVTDYLITNQTEMLTKMREYPRDWDLARLTMMPSLRTTCHIDGDYTFTVRDCYKHFDDSVCALNDFDHRDHLFEVPLRALTRRGFDNMMTAGRSASAEGYGWDIIRCIPQAIMTGQAAGETVCLALEEKKAVSDVTVPVLQKRMEDADVMVHFPDELVPEDKSVIIHGRDLDGNLVADPFEDDGHVGGHI